MFTKGVVPAGRIEIVAVVRDAIVKTKYVDMPWCVAGHESLGEASRTVWIDHAPLVESG